MSEPIAEPIPEHWESTIDNSKPYILVQLDKKSTEYKEVYDDFCTKLGKYPINVDVIILVLYSCFIGILSFFIK